MPNLLKPRRRGDGTVRSLTQHEFDKISRLAYEKFGLELKEGKQELVSARLGKKARETGCQSFHEYYDYVLEDRTGEALIDLIDALTTNFTGFMREPTHFDFLRKRVLPEWQRRGCLNVWSAACSTGEEPYTIAFSLLEELGSSSALQFRICATDISSRALNEAQRAVYPAGRLQHMSSAWLRAYFLKGERDWKDWFRVKPEIVKRVDFRRLNLIETFSLPDRFGAIFCRNVMIYFDKPTQQSVVNNLAAHLEPGGYLLIGHSESLTGITHPLTYVQPTIYRKPPK